MAFLYVKSWMLLALFLHAVRGYGSGAPEGTCDTMLPGHGEDPQSSPSPYITVPESTSVTSGSPLPIKIQGVSNEHFKGFLIQARSVTNNDTIGAFVPDNAAEVKLINCHGALKSGATHSKSDPKLSAKLTWVAPLDYDGDVIFYTTYVQDGATYWVAVPSKPVRVAKAVPTTTTSLPSTNPASSSRIPAAQSTTTPRVAASRANSATEPWNFTGGESLPTPAPLHQIYNGCNHIKTCFGSTATCVASGDCGIVVTYEQLAGLPTRYRFELRGKVPAGRSNGYYVAVGFSKDDRMGQDNVHECVLWNGQVRALGSYNGGKSNTRMPDLAERVSDVSGQFQDGYIYCQFVRDQVVQVSGMTFDLSEKHFVLIARGPAGADKIQYHDERLASGSAVSFAGLENIAGKDNILLKLHGAFMITAWVWAASCGILCARYFKRTWVGRQICGKDLWFVFHRSLMLLVWSLTIAAFVLIFLHVQGWTEIPQSSNPHAVIGCVTTALAFIQPIMAAFRPHPGTPKRSIFNWAHWFVGNAAHILAIVTIFLSFNFTHFVEAVKYLNPILVTFVAFHAVSHFFLTLLQCCKSENSNNHSNNLALKEMGNGQSQHFHEPQKEDSPGSGLRQVTLVTYFIVVSCLTAALIAVIVMHL